MNHDYKYEHLREEDRNSLIPAIRSSKQVPNATQEQCVFVSDWPRSGCYQCGESREKHEKAQEPQSDPVKRWEFITRREYATPGESCEDAGHNWRCVGTSDDGDTFYTCRDCGEECEA